MRFHNLVSRLNDAIRMSEENLTVTPIDANNVDDIIKDQYLAAELDEVIRLQKYAKEVRMVV